MTKIASIVRRTRPMPPPDILDTFAPIGFVADQRGLGEWVRETFIAEDGPLHNERHAHLDYATIGWLWTNAENMNRDKPVAGECRMIQPAQRKWSSQMAHAHLQALFGYVPDFLITISAQYAAEADDWTFCALIEHELCHAAQDVNQYGEPRFNKDSGEPIFRLVTHDVEQFTDVVERYGSGAAGVDEMVRAANKGATIGEARMRIACGTCARKVG